MSVKVNGLPCDACGGATKHVPDCAWLRESLEEFRKGVSSIETREKERTKSAVVLASTIQRGEFFRKRNGTYVYMRISSSSAKFYGLNADERVYGVCFNGNATDVAGDCAVHKADVSEFFGNREDRDAWNRTFSRLEPEPFKRSNEEIRRASGEVQCPDRFVLFFYLLLRDHMPAGKVEEIATEAVNAATYVRYTNGWIAQFAMNIVESLRADDEGRKSFP